jgi:hypothetical protein
MFFRRESLPLCFSAEGIPSGCNLLPLHGDKGVLYDSIRTVRYTVRGPLPPYGTGSAGDCSSPIGKSGLIYGTATCNCFSIYCSLTNLKCYAERRRDYQRRGEKRRRAGSSRGLLILLFPPRSTLCLGQKQPFTRQFLTVFQTNAGRAAQLRPNCCRGHGERSRRHHSCPFPCPTNQ